MKGHLVIAVGLQVPKVGWKIKTIKQLANGLFEIELEPP